MRDLIRRRVQEGSLIRDGSVYLLFKVGGRMESGTFQVRNAWGDVRLTRLELGHYLVHLHPAPRVIQKELAILLREVPDGSAQGSFLEVFEGEALSLVHIWFANVQGERIDTGFDVAAFAPKVDRG